MKKGVRFKLNDRAVGRIFTCLLVFIALVLIIGCVAHLVFAEDSSQTSEKSKVDYHDPSTWVNAQSQNDYATIGMAMQGMCMKEGGCTADFNSQKQKDDIKQWLDNPSNINLKNALYQNILKASEGKNLDEVINGFNSLDDKTHKYVRELLGGAGEKTITSLWKSTKEDTNKKSILLGLNSFESSIRDQYVSFLWNNLKKDGKPDAVERQKLLSLLEDPKLKEVKSNLINSIQKASLESNTKYGKKFADSLKDAIKLDTLKTKYSVDSDGKEHLYISDSKGNGKFDLLDPSVMFKNLEEKGGVLSLNFFTNKPDGTDTVTLNLGAKDLDNLPGEIKINNNFEVKDGKRNFQKGFGDLSIGDIRVGNPFFGSGNREITISADEKSISISGKGNAVLNYYDKSGDAVTRNIFVKPSPGKEGVGFSEIFTKGSDGKYSSPQFKNSDVYYTLNDAYNRNPYSDARTANIVVRAEENNLFSIDSFNIKKSSQNVQSYETQYVQGGCSSGRCGGSYQQVAVNKEVGLYDIDVKNTNGITILGNNMGLLENEMVRFNVESTAVGVKTAYLDNNRVTNVVSYADNPNPNMFIQDYQGTEQSGLLFNPLPSKGEVVSQPTATVSTIPIPTDGSTTTTTGNTNTGTNPSDVETLPGVDPFPSTTNPTTTQPTTETPTTNNPTTTPTTNTPVDEEGFGQIPGESGVDNGKSNPTTPTTGNPNSITDRVSEVNNAIDLGNLGNNNPTTNTPSSQTPAGGSTEDKVLSPKENPNFGAYGAALNDYVTGLGSQQKGKTDLDIVKIGADWCGGCRIQEKEMTVMAKDYSGVGFYKAESSQMGNYLDNGINPQTGSQYGIPQTLFIYKGEAYRYAGEYVLNKDTMTSYINQFRSGQVPAGLKKLSK